MKKRLKRKARPLGNALKKQSVINKILSINTVFKKYKA